MAYRFNNRNAPRGCPCIRDCPDRKVGCHAKCEKYLEWRKKVDEKNKEERMKQDVQNAISESAKRKIWKSLRYQSNRKHYRDNDFR